MFKWRSMIFYFDDSAVVEFAGHGKVIHIGCMKLYVYIYIYKRCAFYREKYPAVREFIYSINEDTIIRHCDANSCPAGTAVRRKWMLVARKEISHKRNLACANNNALKNEIKFRSTLKRTTTRKDIISFGNEICWFSIMDFTYATN